MNRQTKIILGVASFWPLCWILILFAFLFLMALTDELFQDDTARTHLFLLLPLYMLLVVTVLDILALLVIYAIDLIRNPGLDNEKKALWVAVLVLAPFFAMPAYWYLYVWVGRPEE